ncbi:hypothetical protein B566_EDAN008984 [Ephemera danica]|nr:hypothetical protein B566_EDAN008984 [Ephemera danica]
MPRLWKNSVRFSRGLKTNVTCWMWGVEQACYKEYDSPIVSLAYEKSKQPAEELRRYMEDAGFTVLSCELLDKVVVFPSRDDFKEFLTSVSAYQKVIPEEKMDEFISEVLDELPNAEQEDGSFHKNFKTLQAFARK